MERVQELLSLSVIPHFTMLQKFLFRIKSLYLRITFKKTLNLFYTTEDKIPITAIDSSGFTSGYCSHYYSARTGKIRKHFLKTSISVDTDLRVIIGFVASLIPIRSWNNEIVGGKYRQEMAQQFDDEKYGRHQLIENVFSVLKIKFSGDLKARIFLVQKKEIATKMIVRNIHTFLQFAFIEVFYRAIIF